MPAETQTRGRGNPVFYFVALTLLLIALFALAQEWVRPSENVRSAKVATSGNTSGPLTVRWGVSDNIVRRGDSVNLWFQFFNPTDSPVSEVGFTEFSAPGFVRSGECWNVSPRCLPDRKSTLNGRVTIAPGQSMILEGPLVGEDAGTYSLTAIYSWRNAAGFELRDFTTLGPVEIASTWQIVTTNLFGRLAGVIVPLSLAIAGLLLQRFQSRYEESRRQQEKEREDERRRQDQAYDAKRREEDNERARVAAVINTLLPTQMADTKELYQPLASRINRLVIHLERWEKDRSNREHRVEVAFDIAMVWRQQKYMSDRQGGFHLQSRAGERLVKECWNDFNRAIAEHIDKTTLASVNPLSRRMTFAQFVANPDLQPLRDAVDRWLSDPSDPLSAQTVTLKTLVTVLGFEINRPFERWYGKEKLVFPEQELREMREKAANDKISSRFDDYLERNKSVS